MTKYEYLARLEQLLADLPPQQRRDALDYYAEYFDAAGSDHEAETAEKLGDPESVARTILESEAEAAPDAVPAPDAIPETPADLPVHPHGKGWLFTLLGGAAVLVMVALAVGASALTRPGRTVDTASQTQSEASVQAGSQQESSSATTPVPTSAADSQAGAAPAASPDALAAAQTADSQVPADWETAYNMTITQVDLELSRVDLTVVVDDSVSAVTLRGNSAAGNALQVDQKELDRDSKLDATLYAPNTEDTVSLTLVLPAAALPRSLELKLYGGSAVVPDLALDELEIDSLGATVTVGSITARQAELQEESDGTLTVAALTADEISLETVRGAITVDQIKVGRQLEVEAEGGSVTAAIQGQAADFRLEAERKGGTLTVDGQEITAKTERPGNTGASIEAETKGGTITLSFTG